MMEDHLREILAQVSFDSLSLGHIDFKSGKLHAWQCSPYAPSGGPLYFDLASLTKPLTGSLLSFLRPYWFQERHWKLLNHRGGLPSHGLLPQDRWRQQLLAYEVKKGPPHYSDFSSLRLMLELENEYGEAIYESLRSFYGEDIFFWKNLTPLQIRSTAPTGSRGGWAIQGIPYDHNAYNLDCFCFHAGLFASVEGLGQCLLRWNQEFQLLEVMQEELKRSSERFVRGFDRVEDPLKTLAGKGAGPLTFGHLGFTGTSFWIDTEREVGHLLLSNATQSFSYQADVINALRRRWGEMMWNWRP